MAPIWNPPSKFGCKCYSYTQQLVDLIPGPRWSMNSANGMATESLRPKLDVPMPKDPLCTDCTQQIADAKKSPKRVRGKPSPESREAMLDKFPGKRLIPEESASSHEEVRRLDIAGVEYIGCFGVPRTRKVIRKLFSISEDQHDHYVSLPALKRRKVDAVAPELYKQHITAPEEESPLRACVQVESHKNKEKHITTHRRLSPTRACAKLESRKRHMKLPRICLNKPRKDCCFNAMDFYHTGNSPPLGNKVYTIPSSPADHMRQSPVASSNSGSPASPTTTTSNPLFPVVPGKQCTMVDAPKTQPFRIKLNVKQQTTPSPIGAKSTTSKGRPPPSASIKMTDRPGQHVLSPPTSQPSTPPPPMRKPTSTAEEVRALIAPHGITPSDFTAKAGLAGCGKTKLVEIQVLWKAVARLEGKKLYPKSVDNTGGQVKSAGTTMTGVAMKSPSTSKPSAPAAANGYSTSSKACQPQKRTSSQAAQNPAVPVANANIHVFVARQPKPK